MPGSSFQRAVNSQYLAGVERIGEMARLQAKVGLYRGLYARRNTTFHLKMGYLRIAGMWTPHFSAVIALQHKASTYA